MRVSLKWLKDLLPGIEERSVDLSAFAYTLDMTGTAVEGVETAGAALDGIVVGQIVEKEKHSGADTLWVTKVDVGEAEPLQIVCGANNFEAGDKVPVATIGATLPNGMTIKKSKLRGELSYGMNCSAIELGIGSDADGLLILPMDAPVGVPFATYYNLSDTILDLEITPNRPDCLSMRGIAREFGAVFGLPVAEPEPIELAEEGESVHTSATVTVEDSALCPRYAARVIRDLRVGPSPDWLVERVQATGARSINNIVDITNLVMFETGQPLHAFDLDTIAKDGEGRACVIVRRARTGEVITTLDEVERKLTTSNLLIADPSGPITLAGVMGAASTEITDRTTNIFLEAAVFDPAITSRTSRGFALISESSLRFERGVDIENTARALDYAASLVAELANGSVAADVIDHYPVPYEPLTIALQGERVKALLGAPVDLETASIFLRSLELSVADGESPDEMLVTIPGFRPDLTREVDLIEEILRLYGMENTPVTMPGGRERIGGLNRVQLLRRRMEQALRATGCYETLTLPFADSADYEKMGVEFDFARLHNPLSQDQSVLRALLLPNLLHSVALNRRRGTRNVQLFEAGTVFTAVEGHKQPKEEEHVCVVLSGAWHKKTWNEQAMPLDFYDAKGCMDALLHELKIDSCRLVAPSDEAYPFLQPGRVAEVHLGGRAIGTLGEVHPRVLEAFDIDEPVITFELCCGPLFKAASDELVVQTPSRFPGIDFDIALVVDEDVTAGSLVQRMLSLGKKTLLGGVRLFDVYQGKGLEAGKKSLAFTLSYRADDRTLTFEEVEPQHERLLERLQKATGAILRS